MEDRQHALTTDELGLADMLGGLRRELEDAQRRAAGEALRFVIADVEVEATVQITRNATGRAGIQFWVVQAGGDYARGNATTHRIKLNLRLPRTTLISDEGDGAE
ncbi:trypco2 family protein [Streptomyces pseudovenezuelae]|uniref:trypco2 family protein n=1 Tax=Streptomyces pseudovenezuelae TaxID=67350 RepID=UPI0036EE1FBD